MTLTGRPCPTSVDSPLRSGGLTRPYSYPSRDGRLSDTITMLETSVGRRASPRSRRADRREAGSSSGGGWLAGLAAGAGPRRPGHRDEVQTGSAHRRLVRCEYEGSCPTCWRRPEPGGGLPIAESRPRRGDGLGPSGGGGTFGATRLLRRLAGPFAPSRARAGRASPGHRRDDTAAATQALGTVPRREVRAGRDGGIEFVRTMGSRRPGVTGRVLRSAPSRAAGAHSGTYGNVIRLLPPLVISGQLLEEGLGILEEAWRRHEQDVASASEAQAGPGVRARGNR